jgi:CPA1 family monovalent cation:H+ antiporter
VFDIAAGCLVLTALLAYLNLRYLRLPMTIGVMSIALFLSFALIGLDKFGISALHDYEMSALASIDFAALLMQGMLSLLLFAGALHVDLARLRAFRWQVGTLALVGTVLSTLLIGYALWYVLPLTGHPLPLGHCLIFGALISPTDPIAVMGILKSARAPQSLEIVIAGESLFNDGVGVVLFSLIVDMAVSGDTPTLAEGAYLLAREAGGGIVFGLALGYVTYFFLKKIDSYQEEVLLTLAAVMGGYALATHLHVSGPLATVVAGVIIGNRGRAFAMSKQTREQLDMFWELLDAILNAVLFVLIGLEVILIPFGPSILLACVCAILITLGARLLSVGAPVALFDRRFQLPPRSWAVLTWGGLRGGISVALALSLTPGRQRDLLLSLTYSVVVFSILLQGLTFGKLVRRAVRVAE